MLIKSVKSFDIDSDGFIPIEEFKFFLENFGEDLD
jgi:Ca2+-binding EF-hand superfamily protein